jgi:hypothetical protein
VNNSITKLIAGMLFVACIPPANAAFTFTEAGATGRIGPTQPQLDSAYLGTELEGSVTSDSGIQVWTVPQSGLYRIEMSGASGGNAIEGNNGSFNGGLGARVAGEFNLTAGEVLKIIIGQEGVTPTAYDSLGGGGGGSFVWKSTGNQLLAAAGGGGGAGDGYSGTGADGGHGTDHVNGSISIGSEDCSSTATPGEGWKDTDYSCDGYYSGGGSGWNSDGMSNMYTCSTTPINASSPLNGGLGGQGNEDDEETGPGGFGGGGGSAVECGSTGGGGGGGYTGGSATGCSGGGGDSDGYGCGDGGGGGGSLNTGANPEASTGVQSGNGLVVIELIGAEAMPEPIPSLSNWSLIILSMLIVMLSFVGIKRRVS